MDTFIDSYLLRPVARSIERCQEAIEPICCELSRVIKELLRGQRVARSTDLAIERYRDWDKKKLKSLIDSLAIERCRAAIEL